jgi:hypothetical protein
VGGHRKPTERKKGVKASGLNKKAAFMIALAGKAICFATDPYVSGDGLTFFHLNHFALKCAD